MNGKKIRTLIRLIVSCICIISMICPAWAAGPENDPAGEAAGSPVITAGSGSAAKTAETAGAGGHTADTAVSREILLGTFTTTGYCGCAKCSGGFTLTYSGTVPRAGHTISADLNVFPIGTRLMIDGVVYTVEDIGSDVSGQTLDIYYDSHEEAVAHGKQTQDVYTAAG